MDKELIFYDFEVFKYNWMVVLIQYNTKEKTIIIDDVNKLRQFYKTYIDAIWIGYNNRNYDQWILKGLLSGLNPYIINNQLIIEGKAGFQIVRKNKDFPLNNFDVGDIAHSLKQLEAFMGSDIKETSVPFDIDRKLTEDEINETIKYCTHDVEETMKVFEYRRAEFDSQLSVIEAFDLPMSMFNKTKAQLSAHILGAIKQHTIDDEFEITIPPTLNISSKYQYIVDWYMRPENMNYKKALKSISKQDARSLDTIVEGVPHTFAWGGVHGAIPNYADEGIILCCDVASLYPSIMIEYGYLSRKILNPEKYKQIRDTRLELKRKKDKRQQPYKIILNSTYGILKDRNNNLYDPLMSNNVCVTGQLLLLDLIEKIAPYGRLIQSNTDGVFMKVDNMETVEIIKSVAQEWEVRTRLNLEWDIYSKIYQKDVNNYIIIAADGHYKSKGAYLKKLSAIDNDLPIINKALLEYFVHNTPLDVTIKNSNDLIDFQKVVKLSSLYNNVRHGDETLNEKVHRVFASTDENDQPITKIKLVKGEEKIEKISYTPDRCFINNDNMDGLIVPDKLDKQYYIDLANERLAQFLEVTEEKVNETPNILYNCMLKSNNFYEFLKECKENSLINKTLDSYIIADCCKNYGKNKRLLSFIPYFKLLYNKATLKILTIINKVTDEKILNIINKHCELNKTGKTYINVDYDSMLLEIFEYIPNENIEIHEIMKTQIELFDEVRYVDNSIDENTYYVLNTRNEIAPNITVYRIKDGLIENRKVTKSSFKILSIQDGDIIKVKTTEQVYGTKIIGKNEIGENIMIEDTNITYDVIKSYDIVYRDYNKNTKLICEEDGE